MVEGRGWWKAEDGRNGRRKKLKRLEIKTNEEEMEKDIERRNWENGRKERMKNKDRATKKKIKGMED